MQGTSERRRRPLNRRDGGRGGAARPILAALALGALCVWLSLVHAAYAQNQTPAPTTIRVGWVPASPIYIDDADIGFSADLMRALGERTGVVVDPVRATSAAALLGMLQRGEIDALVGAVETPDLSAAALTTRPIATTELRLFTRVGEADGPPPAQEIVGVLENAAFVGPTPEAMAAAALRPYRSAERLLFDLFADRVSAALMPVDVAIEEARAARLDHRIAPSGPPLGTLRRVIAVRPEAAALRNALDLALDALETSGALAALKTRWSPGLPAPEPSVLTVAVSHFPPFQVVREDGTMTGFAVEALRDLSALTGVRLRFVETPREDFPHDLMTGAVDVRPQMGLTRARAISVDYTAPIFKDELGVFIRADDTQRIRGVEDLDGLRVGARSRTAPLQALAERPKVETVIIDGPPSDLLDMLLSGEIDAVAHTSASFVHSIRDAGRAEAVRSLAPSLGVALRGIALRRGLGRVRNAFDGVLPAYVASSDYQELRRAWFEPPPFWTTERIALAGGVGGALAIGLGGWVAATRMRRRRREQARERRRLETERLNQSMQTVLETTNDGVLALGPAGEIVLLNSAARHMLGGLNAPTPFAWPKAIRFLNAGDMTELGPDRDPLASARAGRPIRSETMMMTRASGDAPRYVRVSSNMVGAPDTAIRVVLSLDDVSEEEARRQQIERSSRLEALGQLTGGIAHDFNNLLAAMQYSIELARAEPGHERAPRLLDGAIDTIGRGVELSRRLLAFAKRQPGLAASRSAREALESLAALVERTIEAAITLEIRVEDDDLWVYCDQGQLENALLNLVLNSRDAIIRSGKGDRIVIAARAVDQRDAEIGGVFEQPHAYTAAGMRAAGDRDRARNDGRSVRYVELSVTDNGPGMSDEVKRRAIDPFFTTKSTNSGTGLGLSQVYGFAQQANGELRIYSEIGQGTTVRLLLPRGTQGGAREAPVARAPIERGDGATILLVEDDPMLLAVMAETLDYLGYTALPASSGAEALALVEDGAAFDLLLTDIVMPGGIGGFELARRLRAQRADTPVLYMSGYTGFSDEEMGAIPARLLAKPCEPAVVAAEIRQALAGAAI